MGHVSKVRDENYINIQGWMINNLQLSGNELLAYAVIYGFSQAEGQYMTCNQDYIADWLNLSREATNRLLKRMVEKKLIIKRLAYQNGSVKAYDYKAISKEEFIGLDDTSDETSHAATSDETSHVNDSGASDETSLVASDETSLVTCDVSSHHNKYIYNLDNKEKYKKEKPKPKNKSKPPNNAFNNFMQNDYDTDFYEQLEKDILSN